MEKGYFSPREIFENNVNEASGKVNQSIFKVFLLGILAGAFIAVGGEASNAAIHAVTNPGLAKTMAGVIFPVGLMMILIVGGQLFTGNCLLFMGTMEKKIAWKKMGQNWILVYFGNFIGGLLIAFLVLQSGQFNLNGGRLGAFTIQVAVGKVALSPSQAFCSGIMCNIIVCIAILMAGATKDIAGKCITVFFAIFAFVVSGFEHCVANMYYLSAGLFAAHNDTYVEQAKTIYQLTDSQIRSLNVGSIFVKNLLPVTIGNIIGGGLLVGGVFFVLYHTKHKA